LVALDARADWTVATADAPFSVIHATSLYHEQATVGVRLVAGDIVQTSLPGGIQLQDDAGNILALAGNTRALLDQHGSVSLLSGWVKYYHACGSSSCDQPVLETERAAIAPENGAAVVLATTAGHAGSVAVFSERGMNRLTVHVDGRAAPLRADLSGGQFASFDAATPPGITATVSNAFVAAMPVNFRDALRPLPSVVRNDPGKAPAPTPVAYDDISAWLTSALPARNRPATRFATRFRSRLSDAAFRYAIDSHLGILPEWRVLLAVPRHHPDIRRLPLPRLQ
jgi:hypothetical protein